MCVVKGLLIVEGMKTMLGDEIGNQLQPGVGSGNVYSKVEFTCKSDAK